MTVEEYHRPDTLEEALSLRAEFEDGIHVVSGGTLTMPAMNEGHLLPKRVMDLRSLDLDYINEANGETTLGATLTYSDVIDRVDDPFLTEAAYHCGSWAVRNVGTIGGNFFGLPTVGDFAVALLAREAEVKLERDGGERWVALSDFYTGPGTNVLESDELLTATRFPSDVGEAGYRKQSRQQEPAPSIVTVAAHLERANGSIESARIGLNGAGAHPIRAEAAERVLEGASLGEETIEEATGAAAEAATPPTDAIASEWYRRKMIEKQLERVLTQLANGGGLA